MNHLLIALFIVLAALMCASISTFIMSIGATKGWNKHMVFQDCFFLAIALWASEMSYKDYSHNPDPVDIMWILAVFYLIIFRVPKWGVIK